MANPRANRRFQALARPPRAPMARHCAIVLLWYGVPNARFMAPRFIDQVCQNIKRQIEDMRGLAAWGGNMIVLDCEFGNC